MPKQRAGKVYTGNSHQRRKQRRLAQGYKARFNQRRIAAEEKR